MNNLKIRTGLIRIVDKIALRILLLLLGLSLAELFVRTMGFRPWHVSAANQIRNEYFEVAPEVGWYLRPQNQTRIWSGTTYHSETILPDHTRLVTGTSAKDESPTVLIVGDSAIHGWGLSDEDTFASKLARQIPNWRVVNGAVPGYGSLQAYLRTRQLLSHTRPQLVIMGYADYFPERDLALLSWTVPVAVNSTKNNVELPYADVRDGRLYIEPPAPVFIELPLRRYLAIIRVIEEVVAGIPAAFRRHRIEQIPLVILQEWARVVSLHGAIPVVLLWNNSGQLAPLAEALSRLGIRVADCSHSSQLNSRPIQGGDGHPTAELVESWALCLSSRHTDIFASAMGKDR